MKEIALYDPVVSERVMDSMSDQMFTQINIHHNMVRIAQRIYLREAKLKQRAERSERALHRERKKNKLRARMNSLGYSAVLGTAGWFAHVAFVNGLMKFDCTMPLVIIATMLATWTLCGWCHDIKRKKD